MKIVHLKLSNNSIAQFNNSIDKIIHTHRTEIEPFHIIAHYEAPEPDAIVVPWWRHIEATLKVWRVLPDSLWSRHIVFINPTPVYNVFVQSMTRWLGRDWHVFVVATPEDAYELLESLISA